MFVRGFGVEIGGAWMVRMVVSREGEMDATGFFVDIRVA